MPDPQLSIVIPARNAAATLPATLAGLVEQRGAPEFEVLLVDDGSTDATSQIARHSPVVSRLLRLDGRGPGHARNAGAGAARSGRLGFLDADCRPVPGWLASGHSALDSADLVIGETRPDPTQSLGPFDRTLSVVGFSPLFESANLFVRRALFDALGGFESWLGPRDGKELGEDVWFGWRAVRCGAQIASCPDALAYHHVFPRSVAGFVAERWRLRFFPAMARRMPELREAFFYRRWFLSARSASFDAAVLGIALALVSGRVRFAPAAAPYGRLLLDDVRSSGRLVTPAGRLAADAMGLAAMAVGSARHRSLLL
jgi:glycosyltransferase involved in cell wall biosynthesis